MPASSNVITAAGTQFAISAALPATHDLDGFTALSYTDIGEIVDGGSAGKTFNKVDHSSLGNREVLSLKGSYTQGIRTLQLGRDISDAGQDIVLDALDSDNAYSFRVTYQNGDIDYLTATVDSYTDDIGTIDTIVGSTVAVAQCQLTIRALDTGVLTATVNAGGTYTGVTDGTFAATQASTSGSGTGAEFSVTLVAGAVTAASVTKTGSGYVVADTINLSIAGGPVESIVAVLDVASII